MKLNNKKIEKTSTIINYVIAIILCAFLISLSNKLIDDVDDWKERPYIEQFQDKNLIDLL